MPRESSLTQSRTGQLLFGRWSLVAASVILIGAVVIPSGGVGIQLCLFKKVTGLPCFGCGLTRSVICTAHGQLTQALIYNPFGLLVMLTAIACLALRFLPPRAWRRHLGAWIQKHDETLNPLAMWILFVFFGFGLVRVVLLLLELWPWPRPW